MSEIDNLKRDVLELSEEVKLLRKDVHDLVSLWEQAKGVVTFVKWSASIVGTLSALFLFLKDHIK